MMAGSLSYHFENSYAATFVSVTDLRNSQSIKKQQKNIETNLNNYLDTVTEDGTVSVSFDNLGSVNDSADSNYAQLYQEGSLETEAQANTARTSASTYKLYIAAYLMNQKLNGNFDWTAQNTDGFTRMIVNSENDFAEAQLANYGANAIDTFASSQGWYPAVFQNGRAAETTSYSLQLLLEDLAKGQGAFTNKSDRTKLLNLMGNQIYRTGIPSGVAKAKKGTTVQDKVGFLDDTNNDAAIVTLPDGQRYILVIMTNGHNQSGLSGFPRIATIAKNVQKIVYGSDAGTKIENYS